MKGRAASTHQRGNLLAATLTPASCPRRRRGEMLATGPRIGWPRLREQLLVCFDCCLPCWRDHGRQAAASTLPLPLCLKCCYKRILLSHGQDLCWLEPVQGVGSIRGKDIWGSKVHPLSSRYLQLIDLISPIRKSRCNPIPNNVRGSFLVTFYFTTQPMPERSPTSWPEWSQRPTPPAPCPTVFWPLCLVSLRLSSWVETKATNQTSAGMDLDQLAGINADIPHSWRLPALSLPVSRFKQNPQMLSNPPWYHGIRGTMNVRRNFKWTILFFESMVTFLNRLVLYLVLIFHFMTTFFVILVFRMQCNTVHYHQNCRAKLSWKSPSLDQHWGEPWGIDLGKRQRLRKYKYEPTRSGKQPKGFPFGG